jgi:hypothetical protein
VEKTAATMSSAGIVFIRRVPRSGRRRSPSPAGRTALIHARGGARPMAAIESGQGGAGRKRTRRRAAVPKLRAAAAPAHARQDRQRLVGEEERHGRNGERHRPGSPPA